MNTKHFATNFVAPALFYLAIVLYFISGMSIVAWMGKDPSFLVLGLVTFLLGYNAWWFAGMFKGTK